MFQATSVTLGNISHKVTIFLATFLVQTNKKSFFTNVQQNSVFNWQSRLHVSSFKFRLHLILLLQFHGFISKNILFLNFKQIEIKFQVFILRKKRIFIAFFKFLHQSPPAALCSILTTDQAIHNFETNANLVMKVFPMIQTNTSLSGVKFRNNWCIVSYFTDQKWKNSLCSEN